MSRRLPPLRALRAFEAAARHLSFVRAAEELHVTPSAVSQQIRLLEDSLGVPLFLRSPTLTLTAAAVAALPALCDAFDRLERAVAGLRPPRQDGPLVVSVPPAYAARWLIPRLQHFERRHPHLEVRLLATMRLVDFAAEDEIDLAIRYGSGDYPGLHVERLRDEHVVAVAAPAVVARLTTPADLLSATLMVNDAIAWDDSFPDWSRWLSDAGIVEPAPLRLRRFDDAGLMIGAALAGLGVALTWESLITDELASGRLVAPFAPRPLASAYHLVCPPDHLAQAKIAAFRTWILDEIRGVPAPLQF